MAPTTSNPEITGKASREAEQIPDWPRRASPYGSPAPNSSLSEVSPGDALQALIAFSALHEQVRKRKMLASQLASFDQIDPAAEFEPSELFVLDDVLQLVAERAVAITGADGLAIALAENNEIVLRAAAGTIRPDIGARIDRDSAFSGACFRAAQVVACNDTESDARVNLAACRRLGARSMIAVPLCGRRRVIGVLEAFSTEPFGFNDSDVRNLTLLAELILGALKPEDEDRFAQSAQVAESKLTGPSAASVAATEVAAPASGKTILIPEAPASTVQSSLPEIARSQTATDLASSETSFAVKPSGAPSPLTSSSATALPVTALPAAIPSSGVAEISPPSNSAATTVDTGTAAVTAATGTTNLESIREVLAVRTVSTIAEAAHTAPEKKRWGFRLVLPLVGAVIIAAFAGGVWWKLKTSGRSIELPKATFSRRSESPSPQVPAVESEASHEAATSPSSVQDEDQDSSDSSSSSPSADELGKFPQVTGVRHWSSSDASTVVLDLQDQVQYEAHRLAGPDRIYFDLHDTQLPADLVGKSIEIGDGFLSRVRVAQPVAGMTRVVLETKPNTNFSVSLEPNPYRLVVEVHKVGSEPKSAVNLFPNAGESEKTKLAIVVPPPTKEDLQLRARLPKLRIVVDAGHGGWDLGTVGRKGLLEKDLVLEIAQRLGKLLETRMGADVIFTRSDDTYIPLDERAEVANQAQADLFISVHANYSDLPSARGVETYYTNTFTTPGAKDLDTHGAGKPSTNVSLSPADLHDRIEQSRKLAASVQRSLYGALALQNPGLRDRGVKEAGFVVLTESAMPGILAEVSFVSSPTDEQKLRNDGYREQIAEALFKGIAHYEASARNVKLASAAGK